MSDFGMSDPYVGIMKGAIVNIAPSCQIIDLTHEINPQNILEGAFVLSTSFREFPKETIFVCVVDPGVGTSRNPVLVHAFNAYFIGPDNGLFGFLNEDPDKECICLNNKVFFKASVSKTFHGRDIFAPVAAHLWLKGPEIIPSLGSSLPQLLDIQGRVPLITQEKITGTIVHIDRFGNLISNIHRDHLLSIQSNLSKTRFVFRNISCTLYNTFAEAPEGKPAGVIGSTSHLEIFIRNRNAAQITKARTGETVYVYPNHT